MEPRLRLEREYHVRFDEADADGWLRPSGFVRYAQDMAWRHSAEAGFDRAWYESRGMAWLVRNVKVSLLQPITYGDALAISTQVIGWRQVWARRRTEIERIGSEDDRGDRGLTATVDTDWVLLTAEGRPAKVPAEIARYFSPATRFARDRVNLPEPEVEPVTLSTRVRPLDVDPMGHMNNAAYVDMIDDGIGRLPEGQRLRGADCYRIGYVLPALPGTPIDVVSWPVSETQVACRISTTDGTELTKALVSRRPRTD
jgi:acyl-CoA thioesterase FadM